MMKNFSLIESAPTRARTQRVETKLELENDLKANWTEKWAYKWARMHAVSVGFGKLGMFYS